MISELSNPSFLYGKENEVMTLGGISTPESIVIDMVTLVYEQVKDKINRDFKVLNICCKTGVYLKAWYDKLFWNDNLKSEIPDGFERRDWILGHMLYGISPKQSSKELSCLLLYGFDIDKYEDNIKVADSAKEIKELSDGNYEIVKSISDGTITYKEIKKLRDKYKITDEEEIKAEIIKRSLIDGKGDKMKFDVVIGNPPYNRGGDIDFVNLGFELCNKYTCMITPAKWQTAEADQKIASKMSYGEFRKKLVPHMRYVCFYPCCKDIFDIYQTDGIAYCILDKKQIYHQATIVNKCNDIECFNSEIQRSILNEESLLNIGQEIIDYLGDYTKFHFPCITRNKRYEVWMNTKVSGYDWYATKNPRYVLSTSRLLDNSRGDTYDGEAKCIFESDDIEECKSFASWIYSRFTRFFLVPNISKLNNIQTDHCFRFVPAPPSGKFDHIYTDEELYDAFNLPQKYRDVIEAVIKERK